ncbi:hypothetical protein GCM10011390_11540 [Aureimonas endophytica]|uniref:SCP domain-containing protein n=1 Tax=Aureimonas endophytica TaxID=2027858 RepID=A0A916ZFM6_9HYPH|nr:CAP domain-containing protein [Aureimonas endophytica]GGD94468.1 hypothetical protein GCM10011390_11540 [Aureimonas endophytica]
MIRPTRALPALGLLLLSACTSVLAPEPPHPTDNVGFDQESALRAVNAFRAENGLAPLKSEARLVAAAEAQSTAMARRDRMDHYVDGPLPERIKRFGYPFATAAENIARGQPNFASAMTGWEHSPGHRRNLLDPKITEAGFAAVREKTSGRIYWTQIFGRPRADQPTRPEMGRTVMTLGGYHIPSR